MKRDEKLIFKILDYIIESENPVGNISYPDVAKTFKTDRNHFDFHARLLLTDGFVNGTFDSGGMYFSGLTSSGFDYYERLKTPVRAFFNRLFYDHTSMVSLFIAVLSLLWNIVECILSFLK